MTVNLAWNEHMDAETARHRALLRRAVGTTVADAFKTLAELEAEELLALKAARVKAAAKAQAEQAYAQATREGIAAAVVPIHPVQATPQALGVGTVAAEPQATAPAVEVKDRNDRWLLEWDKEKAINPLGAQARAIARIGKAENVNDWTVKKGLQNAEKNRAEVYRDGKVTPMKRKPAKPATPFDGLVKSEPKPG